MKTVFVPTPVSEKPGKEGQYCCVRKDGTIRMCHYENGRFYGDWDGKEKDVTHWLKPVPVQSKLTDDEIYKYSEKWVAEQQIFVGNVKEDCFNSGAKFARSFYQAKLTPSKDEWISVKAQLPEKHKRIWCGNSDSQTVCIGYRNEYGWFNGGVSSIKVTHWKPIGLPSPPKTL